MENKIRKLNIITNNTGAFHIYVYVPAGSIYEWDSVSGCSHMLEHMLFKNKGEESYNLSKSLTSIGAAYNAATYKDVTYYYVKTHSTNYVKAIVLMKQLIKNLTFTEQDLNTERKVIIEEYNQSNDNFDKSFFTLANKSIMGDHNIYSKSVIGELKVLKNISTRELKKYYKARYNDIVVVVNCDSKIKQGVQRLLKKMFGKNDEYVLNDDKLLASANLIEPKLIFINKQYSQYVTRLSFATFPASQARDHIILSFLQYCLTGSGLFSLLNHDIREIRGLVYTIHSYSEAFRFTGFYYIQLGSSSNKTDYIISLVMNIITKMKKHGLPMKVLSFYKESYISSIKLRLLDEDFRSEKQGSEFFYGSHIGDKELLKIINNISTEDVVNVSRLAFDFDRMGVISVGSYSNVDKMSVDVQDIIESYKTP